MAYLGRNVNTDKTTKLRKLDTIAASFGGANTTFNLASGGVAIYPATTRSVMVAVNGVIQEPDTAYTVSGSTITFTAAPAAGATFWGLAMMEGADTNYIGDNVPMGYFDAYWTRVAANSIKLWNGTTLGTIQAGTVSDSVGSMATLRSSIPATPVFDMIGGRLTLESGVAVSTTDQSSKTTLYYTPHVSNLITLYDGVSTWNTITFSELSITLASLTASKPYDVFCYNNSGTATLELLVWTNTTTRATALVKQNGRWVKSGATTRRYLGTIYINATGGQTDDTFAKRYVWNANNRVVRPMRVVETTTSWTYNGTSWHQVNASATNQLDFVIGLVDVSVTAHAISISYSNGSNGQAVGIGLDSTTAFATGASVGVMPPNISPYMCASSALVTYPGIGRHYLAWIESGDGAGTTWYSYPRNTTSSGSQAGISGYLEA